VKGESVAAECSGIIFMKCHSYPCSWQYNTDGQEHWSFETKI